MNLNTNNGAFVGSGHNPHGPDLPLGFSMHLAQDYQALQAYGNLTKTEREGVIRYIQGAVTGDDALTRIYNALSCIREGRKEW